MKYRITKNEYGYHIERRGFLPFWTTHAKEYDWKVEQSLFFSSVYLYKKYLKAPVCFQDVESANIVLEEIKRGDVPWIIPYKKGIRIDRLNSRSY